MARSPPRTAIVRRILFQIDKDGQGQKDWLACGTDIHACLIASLQHLDQHRSSSELASDLSQLQSTAQNAIKSVHHSKVERKWRRLYTDASILKGIAVLLNGEEKMKRTEVSLNAIQDLDIALIVCGAPGLGRLEMIHQEIACLQSDLSECQHFVQDSASAVDTLVSTKRERPYCLASRSIKEFSSMPSLSDYLTILHCEPFIVRNFAIDWPALSDDKHMWADGNYLAHAGGPGRVVPVEIGWQYTESDWYQDIVPWQDFLQTIGWLGNSESIVKEVKPKYLAQHNLFRQFPALELDIVTPDLVYSCPPVPTDFPTYIAPRDEDGSETVLVNAWIGPQGTTTPAHFDPYYNAYGESANLFGTLWKG